MKKNNILPKNSLHNNKYYVSIIQTWLFLIVEVYITAILLFSTFNFSRIVLLAAGYAYYKCELLPTNIWSSPTVICSDKFDQCIDTVCTKTFRPTVEKSFSNTSNIENGVTYLSLIFFYYIGPLLIPVSLFILVLNRKNVGIKQIRFPIISRYILRIVKSTF